jgi:hypothetical protein
MAQIWTAMIDYLLSFPSVASKASVFLIDYPPLPNKLRM